MTVKCHDFSACIEENSKMYNGEKQRNSWETLPTQAPSIPKVAPINMQNKSVFCENCLHYPERHKAKVGMVKKNVPQTERRCFKRIPIPSGTATVFNVDNQAIDIAHVMNISETGMLICDYFSGIRYHLDSKMYDIFINIPTKVEMGGSNTESGVSLQISEGIVVRSFLEQNTNKACYGISFIYCIPSIQDKIRDLVHNIYEPGI